jgi:hypothetical protein
MPRWCVIVLALAAFGCDEDQSASNHDAGVDSAINVDQKPLADVNAPDAGDPRQALRDRSLFKNGSFEEAASGQPASWKCMYGGTGTPPAKLCAVKDTGDHVHGKRHLELPPQCGAYQDVTTFDEAKHVLFDLFARRKGGLDLSEAYLYAWVTGTSFNTLKTRTNIESTQHPGWRHLKSLTLPLKGAGKLRIVLFNSSKTEPLSVDDLVGLEQDTPITGTGHLLRAEHADQINCKAGTSSSTIWVPLPLDHGVQVPLHLALSAGSGEVTYDVDAEGNLGARITFKASGSPLSAKLIWTGVVLTREVPTQDLAALYPEKTKADTWLASTAVVNTTHQGLKAAALQAVQGATSAEQKLAAILKWTSSHIDPKNPFPSSLDAVTAYTSKAGSCTAYANLAAAAGRVAGLPTRSVANYLVGMAQQTHSINELYLGPQLGWRQVEPQSTSTTLPADYAVIVRINMPDDEGTLAMSGNHGWSAPGVPSRSLVHPVAGDTARCTFGYVTPAPFPECPFCDNKAFYQAPLLGSAAKTKDLFERARKLWQATLTKLTTGGPDPAEQKLRAAALEIKDTAGLEQLIQKLEQAP